MFAAKQLYTNDVYNQTANPEGGLQFGTIGVDEFGDVYRYAQIGASNVTAGKLQLAPVAKTNHHNVAAAAAVALDGKNRTVTLTLGATAAVAGEYEGGLLVASDASPEGEVYRITKSSAADSSGVLTVVVDRPFVSAIATTSEFTVVHNPWNGVVEEAVATRAAAGVPLIDMTATYYGWLKVRGVAAVLAGGTIAIGNAVVPSGSTAGAVIEQDVFVNATDATRLDAKVVVGRADQVAGVSTEYRPITLSIL